MDGVVCYVAIIDGTGIDNVAFVEGISDVRCLLLLFIQHQPTTTINQIIMCILTIKKKNEIFISII